MDQIPNRGRVFILQQLGGLGRLDVLLVVQGVAQPVDIIEHCVAVRAVVELAAAAAFEVVEYVVDGAHSPVTSSSSVTVIISSSLSVPPRGRWVCGRTSEPSAAMRIQRPSPPHGSRSAVPSA